MTVTSKTLVMGVFLGAVALPFVFFEAGCGPAVNPPVSTPPPGGTPTKGHDQDQAVPKKDGGAPETPPAAY